MSLFGAKRAAARFLMLLEDFGLCCLERQRMKSGEYVLAVAIEGGEPLGSQL